MSSYISLFENNKLDELEVLINNNYNDAFYYACRNNYLNLAKWLLTIPNNNININGYDDYVFRTACAKGHIEVAKWLLSIPNNNININVYNDYVFICACLYNHTKIAQWLCSLDKRYRIIIVNNKIVSYKIINIIDYIYENINNVGKLKDFVSSFTLLKSKQYHVCLEDKQK